MKPNEMKNSQWVYLGIIVLLSTPAIYSWFVLGQSVYLSKPTPDLCFLTAVTFIIESTILVIAVAIALSTLLGGVSKLIDKIEALDDNN